MNFVKRGDIGASLSIWMGGSEILKLHEGYIDKDRTTLWEDNTMVRLNSAVNGPIAASVLLALFHADLSPDSLVGDIWPELASGAISKCSLGQLLSHQCGLPVPGDGLDSYEHEAVIAALNQQTPLWEPGTTHGFEVGTFSYMADELIRRTAKMPLAEYWRKQIGSILDLDLYIGTNIPENGSIATPLPALGPVDPGSKDAFEAFANRDSLTSQAYHFANGSSNGSAALEFPFPGVSGFGSANGLARFYTLMASGGHWAGFQLIPPEVCEWAEKLLVEGRDEILRTTTAFSAGFMKDPMTSQKERTHLFSSSSSAFGFPGEGGTFAFGDPGTQFGFAYVVNQMDRSLMPADKALCLSRPFYEF